MSHKFLYQTTLQITKWLFQQCHNFQFGWFESLLLQILITLERTYYLQITFQFLQNADLRFIKQINVPTWDIIVKNVFLLFFSYILNKSIPQPKKPYLMKSSNSTLNLITSPFQVDPTMKSLMANGLLPDN